MLHTIQNLPKPTPELDSHFLDVAQAQGLNRQHLVTVLCAYINVKHDNKHYVPI